MSEDALAVVPTSGKLTIAHLRPKAASEVSEPQHPPTAAAAAPPPLLKGDRPGRVRVFVPSPRWDRPAPPPPAPETPSPPARRKKGKRVFTPKRLRNPRKRPPELMVFLAVVTPRWPDLFPPIDVPNERRPVPLAVGILDAMAKELEGVMDRAAINAGLKAWTHRSAYRAASIRAYKAGERRRNLDGTPARKIAMWEAKKAFGVIRERFPLDEDGNLIETAAAPSETVSESPPP